MVLHPMHVKKLGKDVKVALPYMRMEQWSMEKIMITSPVSQKQSILRYFFFKYRSTRSMFYKKQVCSYKKHWFFFEKNKKQKTSALNIPMGLDSTHTAGNL